MALNNTYFSFNADGNKIEFNIVHNLPIESPNSIYDAFHSWLSKTTVFTDSNFVFYVKSKGLDFIIMTEKEFDNL